MKMAHDVTGAAPKHNLVVEKTYRPDYPAERKLQRNSSSHMLNVQCTHWLNVAHELAPPVKPFVRRVLPSGEFDLSILDKVGVSG